MLAVATVVIVLAAVVVRQQTTTAVPQQGGALFPELLTRINDVTEVKGTSAEGSYTLLRRDGRWVVKEREAYPADAGKVRELLFGLAQLQRVEPKTSNPELYDKIGVQDVNAKGADSLQIKLSGAKGETLAELVVGKHQLSKADLSQREYFVRLPGDPQSWLVEGKFPEDKPASNWLQKDILRLDAARVREVRVTHADGQHLTVRRKDPSAKDYDLVGLPKGAEIESPYAINSIANTLTDLALDDVRPVTAVDLNSKGALSVELATFDGLRVHMRAIKDGNNDLARFTASFDPSLADKVDSPEQEASAATATEKEKSPLKQADEVKKEAEELNARWHDWAYVVPGYRVDTIAKKKSELIKVGKKEKSGKSRGG
jgi:Domain of unknown function (DUF4340)